MATGVHGVTGPLVQSPVAVEAKIEQGNVTIHLQLMAGTHAQALILILHPAIRVHALLVHTFFDFQSSLGETSHLLKS